MAAEKEPEVNDDYFFKNEKRGGKGGDFQKRDLIRSIKL